MCIVCIDWEKGNMTSAEALRALGEMITTAKPKEKAHFFKVSEKIMDKEVPMKEADDELDKSWHEETHGDS